MHAVKLTFTIKGDLFKFAQGAVPRVDRAVERAALALESEAKASMSRQKHGYIYSRKTWRTRTRKDGTQVRYAGRPIEHVASAPGEPPAVDTGLLRKSLHHKRVRLWEWQVGTNVRYAAHLEAGDRKFMAPAGKVIKAKFQQLVERAVFGRSR